MPELQTLTPEERLKTYEMLTQGCLHLWSKGKMQTEKLIETVKQFVLIGQKDPLFLAHFTAWAMNQDSKDLQVVSVYANSLNSGDGSRFSPDSELRKPNLRVVSQTMLQKLNPKLVHRVKEIGMLKYAISEDGFDLREARHFPTALRTAIKKYVRYRENNLAMMKGIKKQGLAKKYINLYRLMRIRPSDDACRILRWKQKDREIKVDEALNFEGMKPVEIAKKIRREKLPVLGVIGALPKITPAIAVALLEQSKGDEPIILRKVFEDAGVLKDKEVKALFEEKVKQAKSMGRAEKAAKAAGDEISKSLKAIKADVRKDQFAAFDVGKLFMHIDVSGSMHDAIEIAKSSATAIAEMVNNPDENFGWGVFSREFERLNIPKEFTEAGFAQKLFGKITGGTTNILAGYPESRQWGANVEVFVSDGKHNIGSFVTKMDAAHVAHGKPNAVVFVAIKGHELESKFKQICDAFKKAFEDDGVPCAVIMPEILKSSAGTMQAIQAAVKGKLAIVDAIMNTPLPIQHPDWWYVV